MPLKKDIEGAPTGGGGGGGGRGGSGSGRIDRIPVDKPMTPKERAIFDAKSTLGAAAVVLGPPIFIVENYNRNARKASEDQKHVKKIYRWKTASPSPSPSRSAKPAVKKPVQRKKMK